MTKRVQAKKMLRTDAAEAAKDCAGWNARLAARRISAFLDERMAASGLSIAQFGLMALIASAQDDTLAALAARAGLDPSTLSRNLDGLARAGWVEIASVEADRRRRAVWLTESGARKLEQAMPVWRAAHGALDRIITTSLARRLADQTAATIDGEAD